ncbi:MAG TPA: cytochrome c3 family protein [Geobacteraceae bacterium]
MKTVRSFSLLIGREALLAFFIAGAVFLLPLSASAKNQTVCLDCHEVQTGPGHLPVKPWRTSIHAENGISCHDCHGGDPKDSANAMSPERGFLGAPKELEIPSFCGRCHVGIKEHYLQSAHGKALGHGGPTCVTCHGSHEIKRVTLDLINEKSCSRCHSYERAARMKTAMQETEGLLVLCETEVQRFKGMGIDTDSFEKGLFSMRNSYHRLFHDENVAEVVAESNRIKGELNGLNASLGSIAESLRKRKVAGLVVVGAALVAALLCYLLRKTFD